mgnify:CR=1 FL=1
MVPVYGILWDEKAKVEVRLLAKLLLIHVTLKHVLLSTTDQNVQISTRKGMENVKQIPCTMRKSCTQ